MKKSLASIFILTILISSLCGCKKETLTVPAYPLDKTTVKAAVKEVGLDDWILTDEDSQSTDVGEYTQYSFRDSENRLICSISNIINEYGRRLNFTFAPPSSEAHTLQLAIPQEDHEKVIRLAVILFGGFESEDQLYKNYQKTQDKKTTIISTNNEPYDEEKHVNLGKIYQWRNKIDGLFCEIRLIQWDKSSDISEMYTMSIYNSDEFDF